MPIAGLLGSAAVLMIGEIAKPILRKIVGGEGLKEDAANDMPRQKIVLRRRVTPQQVKLPYGQSFLARYERASWQNLPRNVTVRRIVPRKKMQNTKGRKRFRDNRKVRYKSSDLYRFT